MSKLLPACFSSKNNFNLSHKLLELYDKFFVEIPEAMIAGDLSIFLRELSLGLFRPACLILILISFPKA